MGRLSIFLGLILLCANVAAGEFPAPRQVDERRAALAGVRKIVGRHLRLYTDLPASDAVDSLPVVFDAAVPLWAEYFGFDLAKLHNWQMQGYLIQDRAKFAALGLLPKEKPDFTNGYSNGFELWMVEQPSDYFRRHLLLHEGTHGFMYTQFGDTGPGWYMEGMAELLGTHRWQEGQLQLRVMPASREEMPMWGRIKLVRSAHEANRSLDLQAIMAFDKRRAFSTKEYAWCWAMCQFLDSHPRWQKEFRKLPKAVKKPKFDQQFRELFRAEWPELQAEWRLFAATLDYGYDATRMAVEHRPSLPVTDEVEVTIAADRGWQSSGWQLQAKQKYQLTAAGRYQIADQVTDHIAGGGTPWPCEPGGVTLEYHAGRPIGMLLGSWRSSDNHRFSEPFALGLAASLQPPVDGILYLRVNDSPARLSDNRGELHIRIRRATDQATD